MKTQRDYFLLVARRRLGIPQFERRCLRVTRDGRQVPAYLIPGTAEAGEHQTMMRCAWDRVNAWLRGEDYDGEAIPRRKESERC